MTDYDVILNTPFAFHPHYMQVIVAQYSPHDV